jgi:hypothetical protein
MRFEVFYLLLRSAHCALSALLLTALPALAQTAPKSLGTFDSWIAIELPEKANKVCYMVARPAKSQPDGAKRGDILLTITHRPAAKQRDEVSFQSGYPYKAGTPVTVEVEKKKFEMFTRPETDPEGRWSRRCAAATPRSSRACRPAERRPRIRSRSPDSARPMPRSARPAA